MKQVRIFSSEPRSVAAARRFATGALSGTPSQILEAVELMVSELATNSIRHAETGFQLTVRRARGTIRIEVTDHAGGIPAMRSPGPDDPTGRGLRIVNMLSEAWGVEDASTHGKTVWFTLTADAATAAAEPACQPAPPPRHVGREPKQPPSHPRAAPHHEGQTASRVSVR